MGKAAYVPVDPRPTPRHKALIKAAVAAVMTRHHVVERRAGSQVWETNLTRAIRVRISYHGGETCVHRATIAVFRRGKPVFLAARSQQLFPRRGFPGGNREAIDVDIPGDWETLLFEKAKA